MGLRAMSEVPDGESRYKHAVLVVFTNQGRREDPKRSCGVQ
jgi:hypothetical protein